MEEDSDDDVKAPPHRARNSNLEHANSDPSTKNIPAMPQYVVPPPNPLVQKSEQTGNFEGKEAGPIRYMHVRKIS